MHRRRTNARALVAQVLRTMKCQPNRFSAINAGSRAIAHHPDCDVPHYVVRRLAPRGLKKTKDWNAMVWHNKQKPAPVPGFPTDADVAAVGVEVGGGSEMAERPAPRLVMKAQAWTRAAAHTAAAPSPTGDGSDTSAPGSLRCRPNGRESFRETDWQRRSCRWSAEFELRRVLVMCSPRPYVCRDRIN